ncbi:hypothetical protein VKT23_020258 [Stygiomarasmius scandens]|uniref:F-box domain-containing protein n=1 Tax=Marasmiellus scandens TaxID=2682957 RepID=A0ABR1IL93_9AGAR
MRDQLSHEININAKDISALETQLLHARMLGKNLREMAQCLQSQDAPVRLLTRDILYHIFHFFSTQMITIPQSQHARSEIQSLSEVCLEWRNIIHSSPAFWTGLALDVELMSDCHLVTLQKYLERGAQCDRSVMFLGQVNEPDKTDLHIWHKAIHLVAKHSLNVRCLQFDVRCSRRQVYQFSFPSVDTGWPGLREMHIIIPPIDNLAMLPAFHTFIDNSNSFLTSLHLEGIMIPALCTILGSDRCKSLERVWLSLDIVSRDIYPYPVPSAVFLNSLRWLQLESSWDNPLSELLGQLGSCLVSAKLSSLSFLSGGGVKRDLTNVMLKFILETQCLDSLHDLTLRDIPTFLPLLTNLPGLTKLSLTSTVSGGNMFSCGNMTGLDWRYGKLVPRLKSLTLCIANGGQYKNHPTIRIEWLDKIFVSRRKQDDCSLLERLCLVVPGAEMSMYQGNERLARMASEVELTIVEG